MQVIRISTLFFTLVLVTAFLLSSQATPLLSSDLQDRSIHIGSTPTLLKRELGSFSGFFGRVGRFFTDQPKASVNPTSLTIEQRGANVWESMKRYNRRVQHLSEEDRDAFLSFARPVARNAPVAPKLLFRPSALDDIHEATVYSQKSRIARLLIDLKTGRRIKDIQGYLQDHDLPSMKAAVRLWDDQSRLFEPTLGRSAAGMDRNLLHKRSSLEAERLEQVATGRSLSLQRRGSIQPRYLLRDGDEPLLHKRQLPRVNMQGGIERLFGLYPKLEDLPTYANVEEHGKAVWEDMKKYGLSVDDLRKHNREAFLSFARSRLQNVSPEELRPKPFMFNSHSALFDIHLATDYLNKNRLSRLLANLYDNQLRHRSRVRQHIQDQTLPALNEALLSWQAKSSLKLAQERKEEEEFKRTVAEVNARMRYGESVMKLPKAELDAILETMKPIETPAVYPGTGQKTWSRQDQGGPSLHKREMGSLPELLDKVRGRPKLMVEAEKTPFFTSFEEYGAEILKNMKASGTTISLKGLAPSERVAVVQYVTGKVKTLDAAPPEKKPGLFFGFLDAIKQLFDRIRSYLGILRSQPRDLPTVQVHATVKDQGAAVWARMKTTGARMHELSESDRTAFERFARPQVKAAPASAFKKDYQFDEDGLSDIHFATVYANKPWIVQLLWDISEQRRRGNINQYLQDHDLGAMRSVLTEWDKGSVRTSTKGARNTKEPIKMVHSRLQKREVVSFSNLWEKIGRFFARLRRLLRNFQREPRVVPDGHVYPTEADRGKAIWERMKL